MIRKCVTLKMTVFSVVEMKLDVKKRHADKIRNTNNFETVISRPDLIIVK